MSAAPAPIPATTSPDDAFGRVCPAPGEWWVVVMKKPGDWRRHRVVGWCIVTRDAKPELEPMLSIEYPVAQLVSQVLQKWGNAYLWGPSGAVCCCPDGAVVDDEDPGWCRRCAAELEPRTP